MHYRKNLVTHCLNDMDVYINLINDLCEVASGLRPKNGIFCVMFIVKLVVIA